MNPFSNLWKHPRTSAAGLLISLATVAGVLSQQGVSLGRLGSGTVVSLAGALATALLGLLARDPSQPAAIEAAEPQLKSGSMAAGRSTDRSSGSSTAKLGAWLLIVLLLPLPWLQGCTRDQAARDIVSWTPALQSAVAAVDSAAAVLDPAAAQAFSAATAGFDAASNLLAIQARAYLANPSASALTQLQNQIVTLQQQVNTSLLAAAHIVNLASQQHALAALQAVATIVTTILALVQSISSKADVARMAAGSTRSIEAISLYLDDGRAAQVIAAHYGETQSQARRQIAAAYAAETAAGF